jgi:hypothetical protein
LFCVVVVVSAMQDEEIDRWSEVSVLVWPVQRGSSSSSSDGSKDLCVVPHRDVVGGVWQESRRTAG